jgi:hypothetical protein
MATNNKISTVVSSQLPEFVRADHPVFVAFLQAYYEYLEQSNSTLSFGKTVERAKNIRNYFDTDKITDTGLEEFNTHLYSEFLSLVPKDAPSDRSKLLKNIKDFYRARGTEKSYNFLFQLLFNEQPKFYYPKNDILIASSGKWLVEKSVRLTDVYVNGIADETISSLTKFKNTLIVGNTSTAQAQVERVLVSYENGVRYNEFFLSKQEGTFTSGENVFAVNIEGETLSGNLIAGYVSSIVVNSGGTGYTAGVSVPITGVSGSGATAVIDRVSSGNISNVTVVTSGAGFRVGDYILFTGGGGTGANANVSAVAANGYFHPSSYNINSDIIETYNATAIGAYSNSSGGNANTSMANTLTFFLYANTGPMTTVQVLSGGNNYTTLPSATVSGNTRIKNLGILGKLKINSGGTGYSNGARLIFTNVPGGYGFGANGNVVVNATGTIIRTNFRQLSPGQIIGGSGYQLNFLPTITVSGSGSGANITVETLLGFGGELTPATGSLGVIESISITNRGSGYTSSPTIDLTGLGDGSANATANIVAGVYTYPGRFKDDTGLLSSSNYLEDRDYYQNFSYVIKLRKSIEEYRKYVNDLVHPAGMKLWAEYVYESEPTVNDSISIAYSNVSTYKYYIANALSFNGSNSIIFKNSSLTTTNTKNGIVSFWFNSYNLSNDQILFGISNTSSMSGNIGLLVYLTSKGTSSNSSDSVIRIVGRNRANTTILDMSSNVQDKIFANNWYHVLAGWQLSGTSNANCVIYLNDVNSTNLVTRDTSESNVNYLGANVYVGSTPVGNNPFIGCLSEFWFSNTYANLVNSTIRTYFSGANGTLRPSYLGPQGDVGTGITPIVYLRSNSTYANVNSGLGGDLIFANNITNCTTSPSDA